jgi:uncharacterized protein (DUF169 family)
MRGDWGRQSKEIEELLGLEDETVAVTFTNEEVETDGGNASVCQALKMAAKGEPAGSLCHSVVSYPVVTGNTNVSFGDWTARRMVGFRKDLVFVSVPYERMANLLAAIPECGAGTADFEMPPEMSNLSGEE